MKEKQIPSYTLAEFKSLYDFNRTELMRSPCVIEGFIERWPAFEQWTNLEYLSKTLGHIAVRASAPQFSTHKDMKVCSVNTTFSLYIEYLKKPEQAKKLFRDKWIQGDYETFIEQNTPLYCGSLSLSKLAPAHILKEVSPILPEFMEDFNKYIPFYYDSHNHHWLYLTNAGALTPLHCDNNNVHAILGQIAGVKKAILFSPEDLEYIHRPGIGFLDPINPNFQEFPQAEQATAWEVELTPGKMLIFWSRWAHHVVTVEPSITVSYDFIDSHNIQSFVNDGDWLEYIGQGYQTIPAFHSIVAQYLDSDKELLNAILNKVSGQVLDQKPNNIQLGNKVMSGILQEFIKLPMGAERKSVLRQLLDSLSSKTQDSAL